MRQVININEKWAFTKDTDEIPKENAKKVVLGTFAPYME